ncbi:MAG TPA: aminoglycoside phosphotransferase family protein [Caulobacteraceae bacterium]
MAAGPIYSQRLGAISDAQFEAVAERWDLGHFIGAAPVTSGLFSQNVFVTTTAGEFVLRGAPHWVRAIGETEFRQEDRWQFTKEMFFARQLHEQTRAPAPWPMLHDEATDIFGWPYIVMPRMPGDCFDERTIRKALGAEDRRAVAAALGANLVEMQKLRWPFAGDFDPTSIELTAYVGGPTQRVIDETAMWLESSAAHGSITRDDRAWFDQAVGQALEGAGEPANTYVHCDYKLNNLTVTHDDDGWRVSGLFDFHEARFADGALDIVRQACAYFDNEPPLAKVFVETYRKSAPPDPSVAQRMPLYIINDRMKLWEYFTRPDLRASWTQGKTFRGWAQRRLDDILNLL